MMLSDLIPVILALFLFSTAVEADDTEEDVELLIFNRNTSTKLTKSDVRKVLKKANLTGHGYKKEVSYQTVMSPESTPYFKESYFYYKSENCSRIQEIEEELETLIPGVLGQDVANRVKTELQYWHLDNMDQCKVGLEIVFTGTDTDQRSKRFFGGKKSTSVKVGLKVRAKAFVKGAVKGAVTGAIKGAVKGAIVGFITGGPAGALAGAAAGAARGAVVGAVKGGVKAAVEAKPKRPSSYSSRRRSISYSSRRRTSYSSRRRTSYSSRRRTSYSSRRRTSYSSRRRTSYSSRRRTSYSSRRRTSYSSRRRTSYSSRRRSSSGGGGGGGGGWRR